MIVSRVSSHQGIGVIKYRFSGTQGRRYLSNGCVHCGSLLGQYYKGDAVWDDEPLDRVLVPVADGWKEVINNLS